MQQLKLPNYWRFNQKNEEIKSPKPFTIKKTLRGSQKKTIGAPLISWSGSLNRLPQSELAFENNYINALRVFDETKIGNDRKTGHLRTMPDIDYEEDDFDLDAFEKSFIWLERIRRTKKPINSYSKIGRNFRSILVWPWPLFKAETFEREKRLKELFKMRIKTVTAGRRALGGVRRFQFFRPKQFILSSFPTKLQLSNRLRFQSIIETQLNKVLSRLKFFPTVLFSTHVCKWYGILLSHAHRYLTQNPFTRVSINQWLSLPYHFKRVFLRRFQVLYYIKRHRYLIQPNLERYYAYDYRFLIGCQIRYFDLGYLLSEEALDMSGDVAAKRWRERVKTQKKFTKPYSQLLWRFHNIQSVLSIT